MIDKSHFLSIVSSANTIVYYDPLTGIFYRQYKKAGIKPVNEVYGTYLNVSVKNKNYRAHRLAWFMFYGEWPKEVIDHINGDPSDNRITNLRDVSQKVNCRNRKGDSVELVKLIQMLIERRRNRRK